MGYEGGMKTDSNYLEGNLIQTTYLSTEDEDSSPESQLKLFIYGRNTHNQLRRHVARPFTYQDRNVRLQRSG